MFHYRQALIVAAALAVTIGLSTSVFAAGNIGRVSEVQLGAFGTPPGGAASAKRLDDGVVLNESIETVPQGSLEIALIDETTLSMGGDSKMILDELVFDPKTGKGSSAIKFAAGTFYWVTGHIATKDLIQLETPTATIGIRGTEFSLKIARDGATEVAVVDGLVDLKSKITGQVVTIPPGHNAGITAGGQASQLRVGVPKTGDRAIDTVVAKAEAKVIEAAAKANGKVLPVKADLQKTAANDNGNGPAKGFKLDQGSDLAKGGSATRASDHLRGASLLDSAGNVANSNAGKKLGDVSRQASSNGNNGANGGGAVNGGGARNNRCNGNNPNC